MSRMSSLITAACALLLVGLAAGLGAPAPLPKNFVGRWSAVPQVTPIGPLDAPLNLSIMSMPGSNGATWLMYREFDTESIRGSKQQFWVNSYYVSGNSGPVNSTLVYCGLLLGFYDAYKPYHSLPIEVALWEAFRNDTYLAWNFTAPANGPQGAPLQGQWTMQLSDDNEQLTSIFMLPAGDATHLDVTFNRVTDAPRFTPDLPEVMSFPYQPPCYNMTASLSKCPLGFTHGKPPKHIQALIDKQKASNVKNVVAAPKATEKPKKPSYLGYDFCYVLNDAMNFTVRWTLDEKAGNVNVLFSGTTFDDTSYAALGIFPNWPLMQNMDVIMGYIGAVSGEACIRNMYAEYTFGTPVDQTNQTLMDTKVWKEKQTVYVSFTRPFKTGHHDLMNPFATVAENVTPVVAFAFGRAADNCTSRPHYHFGSRGVFGFDWKDPEGVMTDRIKCQ